MQDTNDTLYSAVVVASSAASADPRPDNKFLSTQGARAKAAPNRRGTKRRAILAPAKIKAKTAVRSALSLMTSGQCPVD
eukprot:scaffold34690_cov288-Amphora_coffeaeformis.AAC.5